MSVNWKNVMEPLANPLIPSQQLLSGLVDRVFPNMTVTGDWRTLSGGLSGANVVALFFGGQETPPVLVAKLDTEERIQNEVDRYWGHVKEYVESSQDTLFTRLRFPSRRDEKFSLDGLDNRPYAVAAYEFAGQPNEELCTFDDYATRLVTLPHKTSYIELQEIFRLLTKSIGALHVRTRQTSSQSIRPLDLPNVPWSEFIPVALAATSAMPDWTEFVASLPEKWQTQRNTQNPIWFHKATCHGDLRCANILMRSTPHKPTAHLIDYGLSGPNHPLIDYARLEADLLLRVGPKATDFQVVLDQILNAKELCPASWTTDSSFLLRLLAEIRAGAMQLSTDAHIDQKDGAIAYKLFLLGQAARLIRRDDPSLRRQPTRNRQTYIWFVLAMMASAINEAPPKKPIEPEAIEAMRRFGASELYWGPERRNIAKLDLIRSHVGPIRILAHTGKSYLDPNLDSEGLPEGVFFEALKDRINQEGAEDHVQIILLNPWTLEGSKLAIAEARGDLRGPELDTDYVKENTEFYRRFKACLAGYKQLRTRSDGVESRNIELRITHYSPDATILLSSKSAFLEPYLVGKLTLRYHDQNLRMNVPEFMTSNNKELMYQVAESQFDFFWKRAMDLTEYLEREKEFEEEFLRSERLRRKSEALHESWFAIDPVVGCPNCCSYCFLNPYKINAKKSPYLFRSAEDAYTRLRGNQWFQNQYTLLQGLLHADARLPVPLACGNYTEMLDSNSKYRLDQRGGSQGPETNNIMVLQEMVDQHSRLVANWNRNGFKAPSLCLITKKGIPPNFLDFLVKRLKKNPGLNICIFVSLSFMPSELEAGAGTIKERLNNFMLLKQANKEIIAGSQASRRLVGIHFWRPLLPIASAQGTLSEHVRLVKMSGAVSSVAVGLKVSKRLAQSIRAIGGLNAGDKTIHIQLPHDVPEENSEYFDLTVKSEAIECGRKQDHPVFIHTSCAASHAFGRPDYNATFDGDLQIDNTVLNEVLTVCGIPQSRAIVRSENVEGLGRRTWIEISGEGEIDQEEQTFLRQMLGIEVKAKIRPTHEWQGSASQPRYGRPCRESFCPVEQKEICKQYYEGRTLRVCRPAS